VKSALGIAGVPGALIRVNSRAFVVSVSVKSIGDWLLRSRVPFAVSQFSPRGAKGLLQLLDLAFR
jgi:hypothetical protein